MLRTKLTVVAGAILLGLGLAVAIVLPANAAGNIGPVRIIATGTGGKCLDVTGVSPDNGALLQLYDCLPNQPNQQFYLFAKPGCFQCYQVVARHSWKCLDVAGVSLATGALIQQYDCLGYNQLNQIWQKTDSPATGYFTMVAMHSYKYLSHSGNYNGSLALQATIATNWYTSTYLG